MALRTGACCGAKEEAKKERGKYSYARRISPWWGAKDIDLNFLLHVPEGSANVISSNRSMGGSGGKGGLVSEEEVGKDEETTQVKRG